jgi:DNA-directed RNA polymerase specialized sigma24 family protein
MCRTLEGRRRFPPELPVIQYLFGVMKSIASSVLKASNTDPLSGSVPLHPVDDLDPTDNLPVDTADQVTPEGIIAINQLLTQIEALFSDHDCAFMVFVGKMDGSSPEEIQEITGLDKTAYASVLRLIRRRLDQSRLGEYLK